MSNVSIRHRTAKAFRYHLGSQSDVQFDPRLRLGPSHAMSVRVIVEHPEVRSQSIRTVGRDLNVCSYANVVGCDVAIGPGRMALGQTRTSQSQVLIAQRDTPQAGIVELHFEVP